MRLCIEIVWKTYQGDDDDNGDNELFLQNG